MTENVSKRQDAVKLERTAAGEELSRLVVQVFRLDGLLGQAGDSIASPAGQTTARWRVLAAVEERSLSVAQIARAWSFARQSVQRVADQLERDGLVTYEPNPVHRRAKLVQLTPKGRSALGRIQAEQQEWANRVGKRVGTDRLRTATAVLDIVLAELEADNDR